MRSAAETIDDLGAVVVAPGTYAFKDERLWAVCEIDADGPAAGEIRNKRWMPAWWEPARRFAWRVFDTRDRRTIAIVRSQAEAASAVAWRFYRDWERITADLNTGAEAAA